MLNKQLLDNNSAISTQLYSFFPTCFWCPQVAKIVTLQDYGPPFFLWIMYALSAHADLMVIDTVVPEDSKTWQMAYVEDLLLIIVIAAEVSGGKHNSKYLFSKSLLKVECFQWHAQNPLCLLTSERVNTAASC